MSDAETPPAEWHPSVEVHHGQAPGVCMDARLGVGVYCPMAVPTPSRGLANLISVLRGKSKSEKQKPST